MRALGLLALLVAFAEGYFATPVLLPILVSFFFAILLEPIVAALERRRVPRAAGATVAVLLFLAAIAGGFWALYQPFSRVVDELPRYGDKLKSAAREVERRTERLQRSVQQSVQEGAGAAQTAAGTARKPESAASAGREESLSAGRVVLGALASFFHGMGIAVFVPFLIAFGLNEKAVLVKAFRESAAGACDAEYVAAAVPRMVRAYFFGSFVVGLILALFQWIVFQALGLENAVGLGVLTGFLNLIPVLGWPLAVLLPVAQALLQFHGLAPVAAIILALGVLHITAGGLVIPRFVGAHVRVGGGAATAALLFWGWYWGIVGFLLAIPLTALARIALESREQTRPLALFLAEKGGD